MAGSDSEGPAITKPAGTMDFAALAYATGSPPPVSGIIRQSADDFFVAEELDFDLDGSGEHVFLHLRKRETNTDWLARQIARLAGVRQMDVGYAGLKDRMAVTEQWFSVYLPGREEPDWSVLARDYPVEVLAVTRHSRKLKRGALSGNRFRITVRDLAGDTEALQAAVSRIGREGVPNYFGEQRFGRGGNNLVQAARWFAGELQRLDRHRRGLYLSAARSFLFNQVLSRRVADGTWQQALDGEVMMLDGSNSFFPVPAVDETIQRRLAEWDIHPTGPLWGRGLNPSRGLCAQLEMEVLAPYPAWRDGLEHAGLRMERRSLRLRVEDLRAEFLDGAVTLDFFLSAGSYATVVLRELVRYQGGQGLADEGEG